MHSQLRRLALVLAVALACAGFVACGDDDSADDPEAGAQTTESPSDETTATSAASGTAVTGSGNDEVDAWAGAVCGSVGTWLTGINEKGTQLGTDVQGVASLEDGRELIVTFMEDVVVLTDGMLGSVEAAGAPDVERGAELAADLLTALESVKSTFEGAVVEAQNLPTDDPDTFSAAATELGNSITSSQGDFQAQFDALQQEYDSPELNAAFATVPECAQLG
jgi:hypothetical protein